MKTVVSWLITSVAVAAAIWLVPGINLVGSSSTLDIALTTAILAGILALLNTFIRPVLQVISLPITCLTLGIFSLVINTIVLYLTAWIGNTIFNTGLEITDFLSAFGASIVIAIVCAILNAITGVKNEEKPNHSI
ncbi:MAG: phage holin family protein [Coriobacteriales bacterium]|jgi:putative membrane protein|nr:phage holin family protein [Coriobacteriales bacterium]